MSALACCFWWFLLGLLLGWLLNWLLSSWLRKDGDGGSGSSPGSSGSSSGTSQAMYTAPPAPSAPPAAARSLAGGMDITAAAAAGFFVKGPDDLAIVEGIGPKIRELLNTHGVNTFEQLSKMSASEISSILEKGGPRFKLANPNSWPEQAGMAHRNEWAALKKLQDELYAGVATYHSDAPKA